jgi:hypothetical protein
MTITADPGVISVCIFGRSLYSGSRKGVRSSKVNTVRNMGQDVRF